jgi:hypothetical protein
MMDAEANGTQGELTTDADPEGQRNVRDIKYLIGRVDAAEAEVARLEASLAAITAELQDNRAGLPDAIQNDPVALAKEMMRSRKSFAEMWTRSQQECAELEANLALQIQATERWRTQCEKAQETIKRPSASEAEVGSLRHTLFVIAGHTDPDATEENYRADDREGCLDTVFALSCAALAPAADPQPLGEKGTL